MTATRAPRVTRTFDGVPCDGGGSASAGEIHAVRQRDEHPRRQRDAVGEAALRAEGASPIRDRWMPGRDSVDPRGTV
jgi:hypothetical protein